MLKLGYQQEKGMREDIEKLSLEKDLEDLKIDIDKLANDVAHLIWRTTVGKVERKINRRPFRSLLWAFGAGLSSAIIVKWFHCKK
jgi:hypothetical protein